jgi:hypothetical protein
VRHITNNLSWDRLWEISPTTYPGTDISPTTYPGTDCETYHQQPILGQTVRHINNIVGKGNKTLGFVRRNVKDCTKTVKAAAHTSVLDLQWNVPVYSLVLI